jgi:hypothetical protein
MKKTLILLIATWFVAAACAKPSGLAAGSPLQLAASTESFVTVTIALELDSDGQTRLAATFSPTEAGYHVYSLSLPRSGLNGLGRPTLLELAPGSRLQAAGPLSASAPEEQADGPEGLLVYPAGPVTLRLPVTLPPGRGWFDEQVSVTYMACSGTLCRPPVEGKLIPVRVPGQEP